MPAQYTQTGSAATLEYLAARAGRVESMTLDLSTFTPDANGDVDLQPGVLMAKIAASGKFGPYDAAANDGRQELTDNVVLLHERVFIKPALLTKEVAYLADGLVTASRCKTHAGVAINAVQQDALVTSKLCSVQFVLE